MNIGDWVKIDTSKCDATCRHCGSAANHRTFHGRIGRLESVLKGLDCPEPEHCVICHFCGHRVQLMQHFRETQHWNVVIFGDTEHRFFSDDELVQGNLLDLVSEAVSVNA